MPTKPSSYFACFFSPYASAGLSKRRFLFEKGLVTATSIASPLEFFQQGTVTSPGRRPEDSPRRIPFFSSTGDNKPSSVMRQSRFRRRLWRTMRSPFILQHAAWSPYSSKDCMQNEQTTSGRATFTPRRYRTAVRNTAGDMQQSDPSRLDGTAVTQAPACSANNLLSRCRSRWQGDSLTNRDWVALSIFNEACV